MNFIIARGLNVSEQELKWSKEAVESDWLKLSNKLSIQNGVLVVEDEGKVKLVVPKQVVSIVLNLSHDSPLAGHRDFEKTYEQINNKYYWLNIHRDVLFNEEVLFNVSFMSNEKVPIQTK